jgi:small multidrug resistance pump
MTEFAMAWLCLALAIAFEIAGTTALKLSDGFTRLTPSVLLFAFYAVSFVFLAFAVKVVPISLGYAIWSGVGTAVIAVIGFVAFKEPVTALKVFFIGVIIAGVIGLHLSDRSASP